MNPTVSVDISLEVHRFIKYMSTVNGTSIRDEITLAVKYYKKKYGVDVTNVEIQNPLIYPTNKKPVILYVEDKKYIDSLTHFQRDGISAAADRVIITYQNNPSLEPCPPPVRVNWLDEKYLNWKKLLP